MLQRAASASNFNRGRKPTFSEGSIVEDRDFQSRGVNARYRVLSLLGEGGFAKCYEVKDLETGEHLALKVCERQKLIQTKTLGKLQTEIAIHRRMNHKNIVKFYRTFQDEWNVYIVLELCRGTTLMDISKDRPRFSVAEAQHIMIQTLMACQYMNQCNVIHRDLKLGNMMMDHEMNVKIGDFGLAAELMFDGERKKTICGTPNYIAPEILQAARNGHSFEVDVWSIGVIFYTLLVGHPPFQQRDVKQTYDRIKQNRYSFPIGVDVPENAKQLVQRILQSDPNSRPTLMEIRNHPFFQGAPNCAPLSLYPSRLRAEKEAKANEIPQSAKATTTACSDVPVKPPITSSREPLRPLTNNNNFMPLPLGNGVAKINNNINTQQEKPPVIASSRRPSIIPSEQLQQPTTGRSENVPAIPVVTSSRPSSAAPLPTTTTTAINNAPIGTRPVPPASSSSSTFTPFVWVTDFSDFSDRYGLGYRLSSGHTGCHFNDNTKLIWEPVTNRSEYYARITTETNGQQIPSDQRQPFLMTQSPEELKKKTTLIKYFKTYIQEGGKPNNHEVVRCSPVPSSCSSSAASNMTSDMIYIRRWMHAATNGNNANNGTTLFRFSNGNVQVCFANEKIEVVFSGADCRNLAYSDSSSCGIRRPMSFVAARMEGGQIWEKVKEAQELVSKMN